MIRSILASAGTGLFCCLAVAGVNAADVGDAPAFGVPTAISALPSNRLLTLADLSDFALRNHPTTRAAWAAALLDRAGLEAALALAQPSVALSLPLTLEHGGSAAPAVSRAIAPSLSLSWVLFDFGGAPPVAVNAEDLGKLKAALPASCPQG